MILSLAPLRGDAALHTGGPGTILGRDNVLFATVTAEVGDEVVFGQVLLRNTSQSAIMLAEARLVGDVPSRSAEVIETRVRSLDDHGPDFVGAAEWPFEDYDDVSRPLQGYRVAAGETVEVLFVVLPHLPGDWRWSRTEIRYAWAGSDYVERADHGFGVCAPKSRNCRVAP